MAEVIPTTLPQFYVAQKSLYEDLLENKLTYDEAKERYKKMCEFIPFNVEINPIQLDSLMKKSFENEPTWNEYKRIYTVELKKQ